MQISLETIYQYQCYILWTIINIITFFDDVICQDLELLEFGQTLPIRTHLTYMDTDNKTDKYDEQKEVGKKNN